MTLTNINFEDLNSTSTDIQNGSINMDSLYCSHLWKNSYLRDAIINAPFKENKSVKYCYTCRGKIRKYELKPTRDTFIPYCHSTPNRNLIKESAEFPADGVPGNSSGYIDEDVIKIAKDNKIDACQKQSIPSISSQIDLTSRQRYVSHEVQSNHESQRRLRKSLKGVGCIVNFALTSSPAKKRTQIQACSISIMVVAIVIITVILVNFTSPNFTRANVRSTTVVPIENILQTNQTTLSAITNSLTDLTPVSNISSAETTFVMESSSAPTTEISSVTSILSKIRKNIRTYPKDPSKGLSKTKHKNVNNITLSPKFCSCQNNEICMLDENSGTAVCKLSVDLDDPTGCGGLCALETEACQLVDKARGVRVCRLLNLVSCSSEEWRCRNGLCVASEARCDGSIQCYDRSDEMHCDCDLTRQFRCGHSISCFPNSKTCDGVIDCWDGFDEMNCTAECPKDQFTCTDGQCILSSRFCDGFVDCADRSDEPQGCDGDCSAHEIRCKNRRCVPREVLCDGYDNCGDTTDELHCSK